MGGTGPLAVPVDIGECEVLSAERGVETATQVVPSNYRRRRAELVPGMSCVPLAYQRSRCVRARTLSLKRYGWSSRSFGFWFPLLNPEQRRGEGGWGSGGRDLGVLMVPSPRVPRVDDFCEQLSCQRRHERCFYQLSSSCSRNPQEELQLAAAQHGCAAVGGPNYPGVCPSREAGATI
jgi:hypothetical protein